MKILITGGRGMIGTRLADVLIKKGFEVRMLSRKSAIGTITKYTWSVKYGYIDPKAIEGIDTIIHLAGTGVFDKRWDENYKKEIIDSRVKSADLLYTYLSSMPHQVKTIISASAIGFYGIDTKETLCDESTTKGEGFLAEVVYKWENKLKKFETTPIRSVLLRIGIVLSNKGGALPQLRAPISKYIGAPIGSGNQFVSWIHIDDLCNMILFAIENEKVKGTYNAVGMNPVTNSFLTKKIAEILKKPLWLPNIPAFVLKLLFGTEKGAHIVGGNNVSNEKIRKEGFIFTHTSVEAALNDLLKNNK